MSKRNRIVNFNWDIYKNAAILKSITGNYVIARANGVVDGTFRVGLLGNPVHSRLHKPFETLEDAMIWIDTELGAH